jgi:predicted phage terminase large subunit-like protein
MRCFCPFRVDVDYPALKRAVREQSEAFSLQTVLIEDKASGTQLIQELISEGMHTIKKHEPTMDKTMRMHSVTSTIENGFVHLPDETAWLGEYLHELSSFPKGKYDDQADSTSQALDWFKQHNRTAVYVSLIMNLSVGWWLNGRDASAFPPEPSWVRSTPRIACRRRRESLSERRFCFLCVGN